MRAGSVVRRVTDALLDRTILRMHGKPFEVLFRIVNAVWYRWPIKVQYMSKSGAYKFYDSERILYLCHAYRVQMYRRGISNRFLGLREQYGMNAITLEETDLFVDVGANVGEISLIAHEMWNVESVCIEPSKPEYCCAQKNLEGKKTWLAQCAASNVNGEGVLFEANATGDSSLFRPSARCKSVNVRLVRLSDLILELGLEHRPIGLLKVEAEGAEPEVLEGAGDLIERAKFISVDVGPERGEEKMGTLVPVQRILQKNGFEMIHFHTVRQVALYRNCKKSETLE